MRYTVITGGSRGIGAAVVRLLSGQGDRVYFLYQSAEAAAEALARETGATAIRCDVSDENQVLGAFEQIPRVDVLICSAGISHWNPINWTEPDAFRRIMDVNVTGTYLCIRAALPSMLRRHAGAVVTVSSMWGLTGASCEAAYSASKAAVIGLTKALAKELGPSGIRVNCVAPGVVRTPMLKDFSEEDLENLRLETPLERLGEPEDVAELAAYLASEKARFMTGQVIGLNGGFVIT